MEQLKLPIIRMKTKIRKQINFILNVTLLISSIFALILSVYLFMAGFHNADSGQNMRYFECVFNTTILDLGSDNEYYSPDEIYLIGEEQRKRGFFMGLLSSFLLGYFIHLMINEAENKK